MEFRDWRPRQLDKQGVLMGFVGRTCQLDHVGTLGKAPLAFARLGVWRQSSGICQIGRLETMSGGASVARPRVPLFRQPGDLLHLILWFLCALHNCIVLETPS